LIGFNIKKSEYKIKNKIKNYLNKYHDLKIDKGNKIFKINDTITPLGKFRKNNNVLKNEYLYDTIDFGIYRNKKRINKKKRNLLKLIKEEMLEELYIERN